MPAQPTRSAASIKVRGLTHRYRGALRPALDDVSFELPPGLRLGLLGPNGAGKTTLMRILCGFLPVQSTSQRPVTIEVAGYDVRAASMQVRERTGYLPEQVPLYHELRVREHLAFRAALKGISRRARSDEIGRVAELTGLSDKLPVPIGQLSRGYRQRVGIADALLGSPPLVILDEPTVGLDPNQVRDIRQMLRGLGGTQTLVFSSHILAEVEMLCDRVVILSEGRVAADEDLDAALASARVQAQWIGSTTQVAEVIAAAWHGLGRDNEPQARIVQRGERVQAEIELEDAAGDDIDAVLEALGRASQSRGVPLRMLAPGQTRLEERFAEVTGARRDR